MFFFFQAEDGIRDHCVTGVQTCALPIFTGANGDATTGNATVTVKYLQNNQIAIAVAVPA